MEEIEDEQAGGGPSMSATIAVPDGVKKEDGIPSNGQEEPTESR